MNLPNCELPIDSGTVRLEMTPPAGVTIYVNGAPSSYLDLSDPGFLAFEYFQQMNAVVSVLYPGGCPLRALHLGAAGCSLAWAWDTTHPGSRQVAVDIDATLVRYVRDWFDLPTAPALRIRAQSAEQAVATAKPASYDVVVRDVFSGTVTPPLLTTVEFAAAVRGILKPTGIYLANCADQKPLTLVKQELRNLQSEFSSVAAIGELGVINGKRYGNFVLAASAQPGDLFDNSDLARQLRSLPTPAKILTGEELTAFIGK